MTSQRRPCAYCPNPAVARTSCPRSGEICEWCCDACAGSKCARGRSRTSYPAAERVALELLLAPDVDLDEAISDWARAYSDRFGRPGTSETDAATAILIQRLEGRAPPLPPSASSTALRIPRALIGLPDED